LIYYLTYDIIIVTCGVRDRTKEYNLSLSSMDVVKGDLSINSIPTWDRLQSDGDGLTTCYACSIPPVSEEYLSETPLLNLWGSRLSGACLSAYVRACVRACVCVYYLSIFFLVVNKTWIPPCVFTLPRHLGHCELSGVHNIAERQLLRTPRISLKMHHTQGTSKIDSTHAQIVPLLAHAVTLKFQKSLHWL
jgi:hypothetical protein